MNFHKSYEGKSRATIPISLFRQLDCLVCKHPHDINVVKRGGV